MTIISKLVRAAKGAPVPEMRRDVNYLPVIANMPNRPRGGRNVYEGYQRGWGLQFGGLTADVSSDPLYREANFVAHDRSILAQENRMNLYLILRFYLERIPFGHIVEYGAYRGGNAIFMAYVVKHLYPGMKVYALDTFEGMPETDKNIDAHTSGDFSGVVLPELQARVQELGLDNLELVKGFFDSTNDEVMKRAGSVCLAHIDCDIRESVRFAYEGVRPFMVDGGYLVFDDATTSSCIGATEIVEDFVIRRDGLNSEQVWPHFVFRAPAR
jgi:predicted O-methyltransferase YrrM